MGTISNIFNMSPETANSLTNFGFSTMAASQQPGITTLAALGKGGEGMNAAALQNAQTQYIGAEAKNKQMQNQLQELTLPSQISSSNAVNNRIINQLTKASGNTASSSTSQNAGGGTPAPSTSTQLSIPNDAMSVISKVQNYFEGDQLNPNDGSGGQSRFGITSANNPWVDVANLTRGQASKIAKTNYWDAIDADNLPDNMKLPAFDAAYNQGVPFAKHALAQAGNDPAKFQQIRADRYNQIIQSSPEQAVNAPSWSRRLNTTNGILGLPTMQIGQNASVPQQYPQQQQVAQNGKLPQDLQANLDLATTLSMSPIYAKQGEGLRQAVVSDPRYAAAMEGAKTGAAYQKDVQGAYKPANEQQDVSSSLSPNAPATNQYTSLTSRDGKPITPLVANAKYAPHPGGVPDYDVPNNESGKAMVPEFIKADIKSNQDINGGLSSLQNEQFRINELAKIYQQVQAGTLTAQNPDYFNKLAALGIKDSPDDIQKLGGIQAAMQNHVLQLINQYKDTNNSMGEAPTRMFGGVINNLIEHGENAGKQPGGLYTVLTEAKALVNRNIDLVQGWNDVGGLGNRLADGKTQRPDDFIRDWSLSHTPESYITDAQKDTPAFKGMRPAITNKMIADAAIKSGKTEAQIKNDMKARGGYNFVGQ